MSTAVIFRKNACQNKRIFIHRIGSMPASPHLDLSLPWRDIASGAALDCMIFYQTLLQHNIGLLHVN